MTTTLPFAERPRPRGPALRRWTLALAWSASCAVLCGCGGGMAQSIKGKVTRKSQPAAFAEVAFTSQGAEKKQTFFGVATGDGTYQLDLTGTDGVPPGSYKVSVTVWTLKDGRPLPPGEEGEVLKSDGRAVQVTRTFDKEVTPGDNQIDLVMEEGQPPSGNP